MALNTDELARKIALAMVLGALVGIVCNYDLFPSIIHTTILGIAGIGGGIFITMLKLLVAPVVFCSLVAGVLGMEDGVAMRRIGISTTIIYLSTTACAIGIAITLAVLLRPGEGLALGSSVGFQPPSAPGLTQVVKDFFPSNVVRAFAEGKMMQIIVLSLFVGFALSSLGDTASGLRKLVNEGNLLVSKMLEFVICCAPLGIFCLLVEVFESQGIALFLPLISYVLVVFLTLAVQLLFVYQVALYCVTGIGPVAFFRKAKEPLLFAFSTSSSNACIPVTLDTLINKFSVPRSIASFTVPFGATVNMDGTAIMQGVATVFVAQAYGVELGVAEYLTVILTATLASVGTAGVPSVGLITLSLVFEQIGLPLEAIGLLLGIDRLIDMARTAVNIAGDMVVTLVVAREPAYS